ncbi:hypothetical protein CPB83DRAFT_882608 [Crepidotus variabilis]|uniref:F-box domain-containing protein n=1 Tax=Crepidotus variabilis TaxID=179855 RepID=A0A9P6EHC7_9AGAR|nr:hypothetical protein CPB83DRAFT_882608 [Crepidotus variabilis]
MSKTLSQSIGPVANSSDQLLIDEEVLKHEESIRKLRSLRNTHSPVSKLPREVLGHIFNIAANWPKSNSYTELPYSPVKRFNFSFVCQHWRILSVGTPKLWCFITSNYPQNWTRALLERSKMSRLTYHASPSHHHRQSSGAFFVKEVLEGHLHRIQELIFDSSVGEAQAFWDSLPSSAPCLRTLKIKTFTFPINFPGNTLRDAQLSTLEVRGCRLDWNSHFLTGLKHLKIGSVNLPTFHEFTNALRRMPELVSLDLDDIPDFESVQISEPVVLTQLEGLCISCAFNGLLDILQSLSVPIETALDLSCRSGPYTGATEEGLQSALITSMNKFFKLMICRDGQKLQYDELHLVQCGEDEIGYKAWQEPRSAKPPFNRESKLDFRLIFEGLLPANVILRMIPLFPPMSQLSTLGFSQIDDVQILPLADVVEKLPMLKMLVLDDDTYVSVLEMLSLQEDSSLEHTASTPDGELFFSNLDTLCVEEVNFSAGLIRDLQDCLIVRYESGVPIHRLVIKECFEISLSDVSSLREIVDVEWDGSERIGANVGSLPFENFYGPYGYGYDSDSD